MPLQLNRHLSLCRPLWEANPLENADLSHIFEKQYNIEACRAYKPHQSVYHCVAQDLDVPLADCCMVATHV